MNSNRLTHVLAYVIRCGVLIATLFVMAGALVILYEHGAEPYTYMTSTPVLEKLTHIPSIIKLVFQFSPLALIQLGLMMLVFIQVIRVGLVTWLFMSMRDKPFILIGIFIVCTMLYSLFGHSL